MQNQRVLFANISNQTPSLQKQQQQQKKTVFSQPTTTTTNITHSAPRFSIYNQDVELENALKRIKELEEQNKLKDQIIAEQALSILLLSSNDDVEKLNIKQNNNRLRKVQQQKIEIDSLKEKLEEALYNNEQSDVLTRKLTQHRIRLIQKLKAENQELRQLNSNNSNVVSVNIVQEELNQSLQTINIASPKTEQSKGSIHQHHYQNNLDFNYGMDNEHPGEC
ncbi:hypothetical protein ACTFIV_008989 [Dictyostelium citrinum]